MRLAFVLWFKKAQTLLDRYIDLAYSICAVWTKTQIQVARFVFGIFVCRINAPMIHASGKTGLPSDYKAVASIWSKQK